MRRKGIQIFISSLLTLLFGVAPIVFAQETTGSIRVETNMVSVDVVVSGGASEQGRLSGRGLLTSDFNIFEDGVRQKIAGFSSAEIPFNLVLLIDTSGSTREDLELIRRAAARFIDSLRPQDKLAIVQFNREVEMVRDLTANRSKLEAGLQYLKPGSGTSFYDALQLTVDEIFAKVEGRKVIVALTDGVDSFGYQTFEKILPVMERSGASTYFLELDTESFSAAGMQKDCRTSDYFAFSAKQLRKYYDEYVKSGPRAPYETHCILGKIEKLEINRRLYESARREVRLIAEQTGGLVFPLKDMTQLDAAYARIADELRNVYSLAYYPTNEKHDGQWRKLRVDVRRPGLTARTRPGYRASSR